MMDELATSAAAALARSREALGALARRASRVATGPGSEPVSEAITARVAQQTLFSEAVLAALKAQCNEYKAVAK